MYVSETAVVAEIAYDRSLVCLAARWGVDVAPTTAQGSSSSSIPGTGSTRIVNAW